MSRKTGEEGGGFVVNCLVGVVGRAVAGGQAVGFLGVLLGASLVAAGQREAGKLQVGVGALQDVAAALGDEQRLLGQPLGLVRRAGGGAEPRQVDEDVGFEPDGADAASAATRCGAIGTTTRAAGRF